MKRIIIYITSAFIIALGLVQCKKGDASNGFVYNPTYLSLTIPAGWDAPSKDIFAGNRLTEQGFQLGRKLFYDGRLSKDDNFPCGSCHQQFAAFATFDHQFSHGFNNTLTFRNAPGIFNIAWMNEMHWDGKITNFLLQPISPITAPNEMAETIDNVLAKINKDTAYKRMFREAFGDETITQDRMLKAILQFVGSIQSYNSKYDKVKRNEATFSVSEAGGYEVFKQKCASCHKEPLFTDNLYHYTGLPLDNVLQDRGRMIITGLKVDSLKFRTPSLRNVKPSFPYMHDGRFYTLTQVIEHYRSGINTADPLLDPVLKAGITISETQRLDLIAFLETLTDSVLMQDKRLAQP